METKAKTCVTPLFNLSHTQLDMPRPGLGHFGARSAELGTAARRSAGRVSNGATVRMISLGCVSNLRWWLSFWFPLEPPPKTVPSKTPTHFHDCSYTISYVQPQKRFVVFACPSRSITPPLFSPNHRRWLPQEARGLRRHPGPLRRSRPGLHCHLGGGKM